MTETLFDQNDQNTFDQNKNYLEELVGEDKKFKSPEELAKAKAFADQHIKTLEMKMDALRNDYTSLSEQANTQAKLQELIDRIESKKTESSSATPSANDQEKPFDPSTLDELIVKKLEEKETFKTQQQNLKTVQDKIKEVIGNNPDALKAKMNNLGLSEEDVINWSKKSPTAVINALGLQEAPRQDFMAPPRSSQRTDNFAPTAAGHKKWSYYLNLQKTDPKTFHDPKTNIQIDRDSQALGEAFFDA